MFKINFPVKKKRIVLAVGPESAGNFSLYTKGQIYFSKNFGDLLLPDNYKKYEKTLKNFLKKNKIKPAIIVCDLHPLYKTSELTLALSRKYGAKIITAQHHLAHIFSAVGESMLAGEKKINQNFIGIACDGTGFGLDGKIWGGEIFKVQSSKFKVQSVKRVGHLENQILIGGDLAIRQPARLLIGILNKLLSEEEVYHYLKKYYSQNQFEVLRNQLKENFNCQETSSSGRILDAASVLLGFSGNERKYKHGPIDLLEKNSGKPYRLKPAIIFAKKEKQYILLTTPLFAYLVRNLRRDRKRLAATAQAYIAQGLHEIAKLTTKGRKPKSVFFSGGLAANKIISAYLISHGVKVNKKIPPGDAGLSFGQTIYYLLSAK